MVCSFFFDCRCNVLDPKYRLVELGRNNLSFLKIARQILSHDFSRGRLSCTTNMISKINFCKNAVEFYFLHWRLFCYYFGKKSSFSHYRESFHEYVQEHFLNSHILSQGIVAKIVCRFALQPECYQIYPSKRVFLKFDKSAMLNMINV